MVYRKSRAFKAYERSLGRPRKLLSIESKLSDPPGPRSRLKSESLRGGAVVLMSACFELFMREVLTGAVDWLQNRFKRSDHAKLPKNFVYNNDMNALNYLKFLEKNDKLIYLQQHAIAVSQKNIISESFNKTYSNAGPKQVKVMLNDLGITDPWASISKLLQTHYKIVLPSSVLISRVEQYTALRNEIAHNGYASNITRKDLSDAIEYYLILGGSIDRLMHDYIGSL